MIYLLKDRQTICNGMSASSLKGLIYSLSFHQSLLLSPFSSYQQLAAYPVSSADVYFTGEECERLRSQTDVSPARQFQPQWHANKNEQLWRDCLDLMCREGFFFFLMTRWSNSRGSSKVQIKPQFCEVDLYKMRLYIFFSPHTLKTISWQNNIHLLPTMGPLCC